MTNPFLNDPLSVVWEAFKNLYPDKDCLCQWQPDMKDEDGKEVYGCTTFEDGQIFVEVSAELKVFDATEVFAHELAHVVVGDAEGHGQAWQDAFDAIYEEYNRILDGGKQGYAIETGETCTDTDIIEKAKG